ncbi:unnamed protein product, partial [marine sediment metagenome]
MVATDFKKLRSLFKMRGMDASEFEASYNELIHRIEESLVAEPQGEWGDSRRIREYSLVLRQVLLHRAIKLLLGSLTALSDDNIYSMALSIRGHFETTAALGYLHNRLNSLSEGNLEARVVDHDICTQLLGTKEEGLLKEAIQYDMEAKQVLNMLKYADRSVSKHILKGSAKEHNMLTDSYKFLCEFSHPNFHSNSAAFEFKREEKKFCFMHNKSITDEFFVLIDYLLVSNPLFVELFD